eukprot:6074184-Prymnesium_polylepis.2
MLLRSVDTTWQRAELQFTQAVSGNGGAEEPGARLVLLPAHHRSRGHRSDVSAEGVQNQELFIEIVGPSAIHPLTRAEALERVNDAEVLGKGQFGKVFKGSSDQDGEVAIKVMPDGAPSHEQSRLARSRGQGDACDERQTGLPRPALRRAADGLWAAERRARDGSARQIGPGPAGSWP